MDSADTDGDGMINMEEFILAVKKNPKGMLAEMAENIEEVEALMALAFAAIDIRGTGRAWVTREDTREAVIIREALVTVNGCRCN